MARTLARMTRKIGSHCDSHGSLARTLVQLVIRVGSVFAQKHAAPLISYVLSSCANNFLPNAFPCTALSVAHDQALLCNKKRMP